MAEVVQSTLEVMAELKGVRGFERIHRQMEDAGKHLKLDTKALEKSVSGVAKGFADVLGKASVRGFDRLSGRIQKQMNLASQSLTDGIGEIAKIASDIEKMERAGDKLGAERRRKDLEMEEKKFKNLQKRLQTETKALQDMVSRREKFSEFEKEALAKGEAGEAIADSFSDALNDLSSGDVKKFTSVLSKSLMGVGRGATAAAGTGASAGIFAGLGKALAVLGGAAIAVGAIAKLLLDADSQTKDWNKSILQTAGSMDLMLSKGVLGFQNLEQELRNVRSSAIDVGYEFRQTPEDMLRIVSAANEAGLTLREIPQYFSDSGDQAEGFHSMMRQSLIAAKALGVETSQIAEMSASWIHDFGGGLDTVRAGYAAIFRASLDAGIGSRRFFSMVQQATAGLALYNVRIEQTAALIAGLGDAIGEQEAAALVADLQKGFVDEGMTDRMGRVLRAGGAARQVIGAEAGATAETFLASSMSEEMAKVFEASGIGTAGTDEMLQGLSQLTHDQQRILIRRAAREDKAAARQLDNLINLSKGMKGGVGAQAKALESLTAGGKLAMQLQAAQGIDGTPLYKMNAMQLAAFENSTGIQGELLKQMRLVDQQLRDQYEQAREEGFKGNFSEFVTQHGSEMAKQLEETQDPMEKMTRQIVDNTEGIMTGLTTTVKWLLENISVGINRMVQWATGMWQGEIENQNKVLEELEQERAATRTFIDAQSRAIGMLEGKERDDAQAELEEAKKHEEKIRKAELKVRQADGSGWSGMFGEGVTRENLLEKAGLGRYGRVLDDGVGHEGMARRQVKRQFESDLKQEEYAKRSAELLGDSESTQEKIKDAIEKDRKTRVSDYIKALQHKDRLDLLDTSGIEFGSEGERQAFLDQLARGNQEATSRLAASLEGRKVPERLEASMAGMGIKVGKSVDDFIMRGSTVTPIHHADQLVGAKPGGPLDRGTSRGGTTNINIYGGDQAKVYQTVKRALKESGIRTGPTGRR